MQVRETLTGREYECASRAAKGDSNQQIANELRIKRKTVEYHLYNAYSKLNITKRTQLPILFRENLYVHKINWRQEVTPRERVEFTFNRLSLEEKNTISIKTLAKKARVSESFVSTFLKTKREFKTRSVSIIYKDRAYSISELSKISGLSYHIIHSRIFRYGLDSERALTQPRKARKR